MTYKIKFLFPVLLILLLGASLRIYNLGSHGLWLDEAETVLSASSLTETISALRVNPLPYLRTFLYKTFIYYWKFFGDNEFILRLSSAIFGIFSILGIYFLGKLIFNEKAGIFSALLLAISPFHIYYSRELKMYSIISFLSIISVYFLCRALRDRNNIFWLGYIVSSILSIYIHSIAFFLLVAQILFFLFFFRRYKDQFKKWLLSNSMVVIFLIPWLILIISGLKLLIKEDNIFFANHLVWIPTPSLESVFITFKNFSIGYNARPLIALIACIIFLLLFLYGMLKAQNKKEGLALSLICLFFPIILIFVVSKYIACYVDRYFIMNSIFYYLIIGNGLSRMKTKYSIPVMAILIFFITGEALKNYYNNYFPGEYAQHLGETPKIEKEQVAAYIIRNLQEGDVILHTYARTLFPFEYYFRFKYKNLLDKSGIPSSEQPGQLLINFLEDRNDIAIFKYQLKNELDEYVYRIIDVPLENPKRIWLVFSWWQFKMIDPRSLETRIDKRFIMEGKKTFPAFVLYRYKKITEWMDRRFIRKEERRFPNIILYQYVNPAYKDNLRLHAR